MSAGVFVISRYEADNGDVFPIRVQPETLALTLGGSANTAPTDPVDQSVFARAGGGKRKYGRQARAVRLRFTGAVPDGYAPNSTITVPILTPELFGTLTATTTGSYLGTAVRVAGISREGGR